MKSHIIAVILLVIIASGCVAPAIIEGSQGDYELPGLNNTTIYYLNSSSMQVVENVVNTTTIDILTADTTTRLNVMSPVAVDYAGNNVTFNVSKVSQFGNTYARFDFKSNFSGFVAFTQSDGSQLRLPILKNGSIRVILPVNYTTGFVFLGSPMPAPDNMTIDEKGRQVLTWDNPYPDNKFLSVKYYHESAPEAILFMFVLLGVGAVLITGYYYFSMRGLKKKLEVMEKDVRK
jgi:hypothetical protein